MRMQSRDSSDAASESILFPGDAEAAVSGECRQRPFELASLPESAGQVYEAIDNISRRIDDLARDLNCLGHFGDGDGDGPRAA